MSRSRPACCRTARAAAIDIFDLFDHAQQEKRQLHIFSQHHRHRPPSELTVVTFIAHRISGQSGFVMRSLACIAAVRFSCRSQSLTRHISTLYDFKSLREVGQVEAVAANVKSRAAEGDPKAVLELYNTATELKNEMEALQQRKKALAKQGTEEVRQLFREFVRDCDMFCIELD
jgi:hypothetical protein